MRGLIALLVALGGAAGAMARFVLGREFAGVGFGGWPATLAINLAGCFLMGWLFLSIEARFRRDPKSRLESTPFAGRLRAAGVRLGPDPTLEAVELFRSRAALERLSALFLTGLLGGFTTFSTFALEAVELLRLESWGQAGAHSLLTMLACPAAIWLGFEFGFSRRGSREEASR